MRHTPLVLVSATVRAKPKQKKVLREARGERCVDFADHFSRVVGQSMHASVIRHAVAELLLRLGERLATAREVAFKSSLHDRRISPQRLRKNFRA